MKHFILILVSMALLSCTGESGPPLSTLHKLTLSEIVEWQRANGLNTESADYVDLAGKPAGATVMEMLDKGTAGFDFYSDGEAVRKVLVRPRTYQDDIITILRANTSYHPSQKFEMTDQYCDTIAPTIDRVIERDQGIRTGDIAGSMQDIDLENQAIMVSIFEKCPNAFAELENDQVRDLWFVAQHSDTELMGYYYPWFHQAVEEGRIWERTFALMTDRLLMYNNYPQVYGSQISNGDLYPVRDMEGLDELRASIGLEPIANYLARFGL